MPSAFMSWARGSSPQQVDVGEEPDALAVGRMGLRADRRQLRLGGAGVPPKRGVALQQLVVGGEEDMPLVAVDQHRLAGAALDYPFVTAGDQGDVEGAAEDGDMGGEPPAGEDDPGHRPAPSGA